MYPITGSTKISWQMNYLIENRKARVLANPKILITNGQESLIDLTQDYVEKVFIIENLEGVLNSTITAYSKKNNELNYKMPKLSTHDWEKIYSNISMITFFQGKSMGYINYNGYCVLNSTENTEYVNPNLMYFIEGEDDTEHYYHDIRCEKIKNSSYNIRRTKEKRGASVSP